uniref:Organic cation/carnitine transporter 4 n=1 Tax=Cajanus cajan TaxID=3821 RepID=A0A151RNH2_CAJCA|nr:hypothetical protein KK1_034407 [Cajanus cajan]
MSIETSHRSNDLPSQVKKICMDEMLREYCGEFGQWQLKHFIFTSLAWILVAFHTVVMIFADHEPHWKCLNGGSGCNAASDSVCKLKPGSWEWVGDRGGTTVSQWSLVCGDKFKVGLVRALFFVGWMTGGGVFGHLSDSFLGRKRTLGVACALNAIFGCLTSLSPNYWIYVILRILTGFSTGGVGLCAYVLASEPIGYKKPSSIPSFLYIILILPFVSESPRWYLPRGRVTEAMKLMTRVRLLIAMALNFLCDLVYYGLSLNVVNLKNNVYLNVLINAVGEMPAFLITAVLLQRFGRKPLTVGTMWFSGVFCLMGCLVGNVGVRMVCGVLGIFGMAGTYNLLYVYTSELFPTVVRNVALGVRHRRRKWGRCWRRLLSFWVVGCRLRCSQHVGWWEEFLLFFFRRPQTNLSMIRLVDWKLELHDFVLFILTKIIVLQLYLFLLLYDHLLCEPFESV